MVRFWCYGLAVLLAACGGDAETAPVSVLVRSDFIPGVDFVTVETEIVELELAETIEAFPSREDVMGFRTGKMVAVFQEVAVGDHQIDVRLLRADGSTVATRTQLLNVGPPSAEAFFVISRVCQDDSCASLDGGEPVVCDGQCTPAPCRVGTWDCSDPELITCMETDVQAVGSTCSLDGEVGTCDEFGGCQAGCIEGGECDPGDCRTGIMRCTGEETTCEVTGVKVAGSECRAALGPCDVAEYCDGTGPECPEDSFAESGTICRAQNGECDVTEVCDGEQFICPDDVRREAGEICRASAGDCDMAEQCDGSSPSCPDDVLAPTSTECRASTGGCDSAENCDGTNPFCPPDSVLDSGTECRAAANECDIAESCNGVDSTCPTNRFVATGATCAGGFCQGGMCSGSCTPNAPCDPPGMPCKTGRINCESGTPVCEVTGNKADDAVCGTPSSTNWSGCGNYDGPCDRSGTESQTITDRLCRIGVCTDVDRQVSRDCMRTTEGDSCGSNNCPGWSSCTYGSQCAEMGNRTRTCTRMVCRSESCNSENYVENDTTACNRPTSGLSCGTTSCGGYGSCQYSNQCATTGTRYRTCTDQVCRDSSCGSENRQESTTSGCNRSVDPCLCGSSCPSCPFVYSHDGETYQYETEVAGSSIIPSRRHAEGRRRFNYEPFLPIWVRLDRAQVEWHEGQGTIRTKLLEGMDEITYLDEARLTVVEHPPGHEVFSLSSVTWRRMSVPNEFVALPSDSLRAPLQASWRSGEDVTAAMASLDDQAVSHDTDQLNYYELDFGEVRNPAQARLVVDGWKLKVTRELSDEDRAQATRPRIEVQDRDGRWVSVMERLPFPRGDRKPAVIELGSIAWPEGRYHMRFWTGTDPDARTMWWVDRIRLSEAAPAEVRSTDVLPSVADLHFSGAPTYHNVDHTTPLLNTPDGGGELNDELATWGRFTRYGDVRELIGEADDRFVIMRLGDGVDFVFDGIHAPASGQAQSYFFEAELVYKARICSGCEGPTDFSRGVEPMPFHGMQRYPTRQQGPNMSGYVDAWNTREYVEGDYRWGP